LTLTKISLSPEVKSLFDVITLPGPSGPVHLGVAFPTDRLVSFPNFTPAAMPMSGRVASGRGLDQETCFASCLGEAVELVSCCAWGDEELVVATAAELGPAALLPEKLNGFSVAQIETRDVWNQRQGGGDWRPGARDLDTPIEWLAVERTDGGADAYAPAEFVFIGRKAPGDETALAIGDSNGCAAGTSSDHAKVAALLELIERDATGRWWYGRRRRARLSPGQLAGHDAFKEWLERRRRQTGLLDITSDLEVPAVAAISAEPDGTAVALGFAARLEWQDAAVAALTEMVQMESSLAAAHNFGAAAGCLGAWLSEIDTALPPLDALSQEVESVFDSYEQAGAPLKTLLNACADNGVSVYFTEMTREIFKVPVYRAISPELCHYKPRFARERLLAPDTSDLAAFLRDPQLQHPLTV